MKSILKTMMLGAALLLFVTTEVQARRFYSPAPGRWLSRDPQGEAGGLNLYALAGNNPNYYIDTNGLGTWKISEDDLDLNRPGVSARATESRGFSVVYVPDEGECKEGDVTVYQIVSEQSFLLGGTPTVDAPTTIYGQHRPNLKCPLPPAMTPDVPGQPNSYQDSPTGGSLRAFTAVAVCRKKCQDLKLLDTYYFEFNVESRKITKRDPNYRKHFRKGMEQWWKDDKSVSNYYPNGKLW